MSPSVRFLFSILPLYFLVISPVAYSAHSYRRSSSLQPSPPLGQVNIAYFIQVSGETVILLPRLLRTMWHPYNLYVVHFDKKIPLERRNKMQAALFLKNPHYKSNVHILEAEPVTYRGISMVLNIYSAMQACIDHPIRWTFFINISGADYPLVSAVNQRRLLAMHDFTTKNRSFLTVSEKNWWSASKTFRYNRLFIDTSLSFNDSVPHEVIDSATDQPLAQFNNFTFVAAEAWMILHRSVVSYFLKSSSARRLYTSFTASLEPEEHFFPTAIYNEPKLFKNTVPHALRHVIWSHNAVHAGQHPYNVDTLSEDNTWVFREHIAKSGCFFTRKITTPDSDLLNWIDFHINGFDTQRSYKPDVDAFLHRVTAILDCIAVLQMDEPADKCFPIV